MEHETRLSDKLAAWEHRLWLAAWALMVAAAAAASLGWLIAGIVLLAAAVWTAMAAFVCGEEELKARKSERYGSSTYGTYGKTKPRKRRRSSAVLKRGTTVLSGGDT